MRITAVLRSYRDWSLIPQLARSPACRSGSGGIMGGNFLRCVSRPAFRETRALHPYAAA